MSSDQMGHVKVVSYHPTGMTGMQNFILDISNPPFPNTTFSSTPESQSCGHGLMLSNTIQYLLGLWCFAVESILHCYLFSDNTCKCAQQNAGDTFMFPRTASALGWTKPHCFGPEDCDSPQPLWNVPHTLPDPQCCDHLTSCSTACAAVCSELLLFTYFLFLFSFFCLLQMDKRGRNH